MPRAPFAQHERYSGWGGVQHHLEGRYSCFLAPTSSCAKPVPSSGIHVSTLISRGPCRLLRTPAGNWFFPTLSLQVFLRMLEPWIPSGCRVRLPVSSPASSAFPNSRRWVGFPRIAPQRDFLRRVFRDRRYCLRSGLLVCSPPRSPLPLRPKAQGSRDFSTRANHASLPLRASGMLAVRIRQLTAEDFHLLHLQPCRPLPGSCTR